MHQASYVYRDIESVSRRKILEVTGRKNLCLSTKRTSKLEKNLGRLLEACKWRSVRDALRRILKGFSTLNK